MVLVLRSGKGSIEVVQIVFFLLILDAGLFYKITDPSSLHRNFILLICHPCHGEYTVDMRKCREMVVCLLDVDPAKFFHELNW